MIDWIAGKICKALGLSEDRVLIVDRGKHKNTVELMDRVSDWAFGFGYEAWLVKIYGDKLHIMIRPIGMRS